MQCHAGLCVYKDPFSIADERQRAPPALRPAIFPAGCVRYQRTAAQAASFACRKRGGHAVRLQFGPISAMITAEIIKKEGKAKTAKITA